MATQLNILIIEDHDQLREVTVEALIQEGYQVTGVDCAEAIDDEMAGKLFDIYIIDINLPGEDGLSLARRLRNAQELVGIIILTARTTTYDKQVGYNSGTDIYLTKPIDQAELVAVVDALGQRIVKTKRAILPKTDAIIELDCSDQIIRNHAEELRISKTEVLILSALNNALGHKLETWQLIELMGENLETYSKSTLEVRMTRLRHKLLKLGADKRCLMSLRDYGYSLTIKLRVY